MKIKDKVTSFELVIDLYVINICFKFEGKIPNNSKVIAFTRNRTEEDADDNNDNGPKTICFSQTGDK